MDFIKFPENLFHLYQLKFILLKFNKNHKLFYKKDFKIWCNNIRNHIQKYQKKILINEMLKLN
jgi:hypothetical protein